MSNAIPIKNKDQIAVMRQGGKIHAAIIKELVAHTKAGTTTESLNTLAEKLLQKHKVIGVFKGYRGFPKSICTSINEQIVHGIPSAKVIIKDGDVVKIDLGIRYRGLILDGGQAVLVGNASPTAKKIVHVAKKALDLAIEFMKDGVSVAFVTRKVQAYVEKEGFSVVRELTGHGVGKQMHDLPEFPNYYREQDEKIILKKGMTIAVEPMINEGSYSMEELNDGWTIVTKDRKLSAWCEHTVLVGTEGGIILTQP